MKKVFISGATGFIGSKLALKLASIGFEVHALYRAGQKAKILNHPNIRLFKGDIMEPSSIEEAVKDCDEIYHVAAYARVWTPDPSSIYRLNIEGALNVFQEGIKAGVKKIVLTSTAGVFGSSGNGVLDESSVTSEYFIHYEHSKAILENVVQTLVKQGANIVIVNPSRVYGPGLLSESNGVTRMIKKYIDGKWRIIPGDGKSIGNYAFIDDVVKGHILAMEKGKSGHRYILGGENASYKFFFETLASVSGIKKNLLKLPVPIMILAARIMLLFAKLFNKSPLIVPSLAKKFSKNFRLDTSRAQKELGLKPISLQKGLEITINWLNDTKNAG